MSTKDKKQACYDFALRKYRQHITCALADLDWAKIDRRVGCHDAWLESMACVAHHREKALWWYARYQKKCQQIAELEKEVV